MRAWLERNKIFFETVAATLLSGMAVIVSVVQLIQSSEQSKLAALQLEIARAETLPKFAIEVHSEGQGQEATHEVLSIDNVGRPVSGFQEEELVVLTATCSGSETTTQVEVTGYFVGHGRSGGTTGRLLTTVSPGNWRRFLELDKEVYNRTKVSSRFCQLRRHVYVRISYQDSVNTRRVQYFEVRSMDGQVEVTEERWNDIKRSSVGARSRDFWDLSADALIPPMPGEQ